MMYILFIVAAVATVLSAVKLSTYADIIGERTSLGGMMVGTLLLAGATSLPELTTSITAIAVDNPDIAVSNVLGSNLFNLFILAILDLYYRKKQVLTYVDRGNITTAYMSFGLSAIIFISVMLPSGYHFMNIGIEMYLMVIFYIVGLKIIGKSNANSAVPETAASSEETEAYHTGAISLKKAKVGFVIAAAVIFISGSLLTIAGDAIAVSTGISSSFVGTFLIAGATSLPEVVTVLVAIQLANYNLAVGNILGSNLFNIMILVFADILYRQEAILTMVHPVTTFTVIALLGLNIIIIGGMLFARSKAVSLKNYYLPSSALVVAYLISSYIIFTLS
ncbi:cation transporter [Salipaludibacillus neizhouensis]|uniref:Cation transporter n=1 Tax=Salipaludibacillus neizhouensis TaxID=885475 RepID=A0A3A9KSV8_9BACI|nr:sodium:calcium antiporter [Salipaludibacillus neizhouensis]RKL67736.1 cation transporter [Salipaludibacillus neizhouensis]